MRLPRQGAADRGFAFGHGRGAAGSCGFACALSGRSGKATRLLKPLSKRHGARQGCGQLPPHRRARRQSGRRFRYLDAEGLRPLHRPRSEYLVCGAGRQGRVKNSATTAEAAGFSAFVGNGDKMHIRQSATCCCDCLCGRGQKIICHLGGTF